MTLDEAKVYVLENKAVMERTLWESQCMDGHGIKTITFILRFDVLPMTLVEFDNDSDILMREGYGNYG